MFKLLQKIFFQILTITILLIPQISHASDNFPLAPDSSDKPAFAGQKLNIDTTGDLVNAFAPFFIRIINIIIAFVGILTIVFIIYNGYILVTSGGNDQQVQQGKKGLFNAILGLVLTLAAYLIIYTIALGLKIKI